jgi:NarL family two-component system response regulator YdfI
VVTQRFEEEAQTSRPETLSERENQVMALLAQGASNKEISLRLHISERTVKAHVTSIFNKLGVNSRAEAVAVALRTGILQT